MIRDHILNALREHQSRLRASGVAHISLFGSVARGAESNDSDIDLVAEFDESVSLLDIVRLQRELSELLGRPVDLVEDRALKGSARLAARADRVNAF